MRQRDDLDFLALPIAIVRNLAQPAKPDPAAKRKIEMGPPAVSGAGFGIP
jgi:hypothetical protein